MKRYQAEKRARQFRKDSITCGRPQHYMVVLDPTDPACDAGEQPYFVANEMSLGGYHLGREVVFSTIE
jgi:hypothetical protein